MNIRCASVGANPTVSHLLRYAADRLIIFFSGLFQGIEFERQSDDGKGYER